MSDTRETSPNFSKTPREFQPDPGTPIRCTSSACGHCVVGYVEYGLPDQTWCVTCAENEWQKKVSEHLKIMAADRAALGDEAFVRFVCGDGWVIPAGERSIAPGKFYFSTDNRMVKNITGSGGYCDTREQCWSKMADLIDKYMREPYR